MPTVLPHRAAKVEAGPGVALELRSLGPADEPSGSAGACSSHRIALTGFRLDHLLSRFSRNRETGGEARCCLPKVPRGSSKRQVFSGFRAWELTVPGSLLAQRSRGPSAGSTSGSAWASALRLAVRVVFQQQTARTGRWPSKTGPSGPYPNSVAITVGRLVAEPMPSSAARMDRMLHRR